MDQVFMSKYFDFESDSELMNDKDLETQLEIQPIVFAKEAEFY